MFIDVVNGYLPSIGVVAQLTFRSVLAPMKIGVAVLAFIGCVGKFQISMAVATSHHCVASPKRETRSGMVEFNLALDYLPVPCRVAGNAGQIERSVRTLRACKRPRGLRMQASSAKEQYRVKE
jgi:hypothetical protein